jgi:hypothetical protein
MAYWTGACQHELSRAFSGGWTTQHVNAADRPEKIVSRGRAGFPVAIDSSSDTLICRRSIAQMAPSTTGMSSLRLV